MTATPPPVHDLPPGHHEARRAHLLSELTVPPARRRAPFVIGGAAAAVTAGLAAAAVAVLAPSSSPPRTGGSVPLPRAENAAQVFHLASRAAAAAPDLHPSPGQFLYFRSTSRQSGRPGVIHRQAWLSVDGRRAGLRINSGEPAGNAWICDGDETPPSDVRALKGVAPIDLNHPPTGCHNSPAYRTGLPTDATAMRRWLYRNSRGGNPPDVQAFRTIGDTLRESYVPPKALSAMFAAAATMPGTNLVRNTHDPAGRPGIAVGQTWHGVRSELIFDPRTYRLIGEREVVDNDSTFAPAGGKPDLASWKPDPKLKEGRVLYATATLRTAVTSQAGRPPAG